MKTKIIIFVITIFLLSCSKGESAKDSVEIVQVEEVRSVEKKKTSDFSRRSLIRIKKYESHIRKYSNKYHFDWRLVVAIIMRESRFREHAVSHVGAKGLMQIMPRNEEYLERELDIDYIYERPEENIKAGIYHLSQQLSYFKEVEDNDKRLKIALASYNSGVGRLRDAIKLSMYLKHDFDYEWETIKGSLRKLNRRHYELHLDVWETGKPRYGYFNNPKETIEYVENIFAFYEQFKVMFKE